MYKMLKYILISTLTFAFLSGCSDDSEDIEYAPGYPSLLAGNWIVFEFQGGTLDGTIGGPYDMSTTLAPNDDNMLVLDNLYNSGTRVKVDIDADTGFFAAKTDQLDLINMGQYDIEKISIEGYINDNYILKDFLFRLAQSTYPDMNFTVGNMSEIIFYRAGYYDKYNSLIDTVMVMGYRKTGFEDESYTR